MGSTTYFHKIHNGNSEKWKHFYLKANARPWEQVQLKMPDKLPGGGGMGTHGIDWNIVRQSLYVDETSQQASS
jgi:hypothetical protein